MSQIMPREPARSLFDDLFSDFFNRSGWPVTAHSVELPSAVRARMDVVDKGDKYEVSVDLPGVRIRNGEGIACNTNQRWPLPRWSRHLA